MTVDKRGAKNNQGGGGGGEFGGGWEKGTLAKPRQPQRGLTVYKKEKAIAATKEIL